MKTLRLLEPVPNFKHLSMLLAGYREELLRNGVRGARESGSEAAG
jgi:hypothetical protein